MTSPSKRGESVYRQVEEVEKIYREQKIAPIRLSLHESGIDLTCQEPVHWQEVARELVYESQDIFGDFCQTWSDQGVCMMVGPIPEESRAKVLGYLVIGLIREGYAVIVSRDESWDETKET